jgi:hypothetical protein
MIELAIYIVAAWIIFCAVMLALGLVVVCLGGLFSAVGGIVNSIDIDSLLLGLPMEPTGPKKGEKPPPVVPWMW